MPLVLWKYLEWGVYFVAPMITLLLAGIDNIGVHIENPILILPMSAYCHVIHDNLIVAASDWSLNNSQASSGHFACFVFFQAQLHGDQHEHVSAIRLSLDGKTSQGPHHKQQSGHFSC
jgi:hypothetical protein